MSLRFVLDDLPWRPWKNGAGRTREIAVEPPGAGLEDFDWRLSVAEVAADAPFSAFSGVERCIVLLSGRGMRLRGHDGRLQHTLSQPLQPYRFDGEQPLHAEPCDDPCQDFNVMTRRGRWRSEVQALAAPGSVAVADALFVLAVDSTMLDGELLPAGACRLWRTPRRALSLEGTGRALVVRLLRETAR